MAESLALGDVEYRMEEIHPVYKKDYMGKTKVTTNLKNSTFVKTENKISYRTTASVTNNDFKLGFVSNIYQITLFALSLMILL